MSTDSGQLAGIPSAEPARPPKYNTVKRLFINFAKVAISLAFIIYLVTDVQKNNPEAFSRLSSESKNWGQLGLAFVLLTTAVIGASWPLAPCGQKTRHRPKIRLKTYCLRLGL